jgi:hypothetical protein
MSAESQFEDLKRRLNGPGVNPDPKVDDGNTERFLEVLKKFVADAKLAKAARLPGADKLWEMMRIEDIAEGLEVADGILSPIEKAVKVGEAVAWSAAQCRPVAAQFIATRMATAAGAPGDHANPDWGGANVHALLGRDGLSAVVDQVRLKEVNALDDVPRQITGAYLRLRYQVLHMDYPGIIADALNYFVKAKEVYDEL